MQNLADLAGSIENSRKSYPIFIDFSKIGLSRPLVHDACHSSTCGSLCAWDGVPDTQRALASTVHMLASQPGTPTRGLSQQCLRVAVCVGRRPRHTACSRERCAHASIVAGESDARTVTAPSSSRAESLTTLSNPRFDFVCFSPCPATLRFP